MRRVRGKRDELQQPETNRENVHFVDMDSRKVNSREFQRQAIDAEIKSLEESIRALKQRRNAVAPISSLPTELIAVILSISQLLDAPLPSRFAKRDHLAWVAYNACLSSLARDCTQ